MAMVVGVILITPILAVIIWWFIVYYRYEKYLKVFPGPTPLPIIGNAHQIGSSSDSLDVLSKFVQKYGSPFKMRIAFMPPNLLTADVNMVEHILKSTTLVGKADGYKYFHRWLGTGLLTSTGNKWKKHRKMLTPAFHFKILEQFLDIFNKFGNILISKLEREVDQPSVDIYPAITLCTLDIICASSMGTNIKAQEKSSSEYVQTVKEICRIITDRFSSATKSVDFLYNFSQDCKTENKALRLLHNFTNKVIASRKQQILHNGVSDEDKDNDADLGFKKRLTFLDTMLHYNVEGNTISDEEIRQEVDTFMFEGHDTTSAGISFILYCLANHPDVQEKVMEELRSIFDDKYQPATYQDLQQMKYLEMVIKESLRLYPPVPIFSRNVSEDTEYDNKLLPKGLQLVVFVYGIHRNPNLYPDPERFDPERFTIENQSKRPPYAYIPFSAGPRNCIGQKFAMLEMKSVVSKILRNFELFPAKPEHIPKPVGQVILKSENGVCVSMKKRIEGVL